MAFDAYLELDGVEGESTRAGYEDLIQVQSFSFGASNPASIGTGTGAGTGRAELSRFVVTKKTDAASTALFGACCAGTHFTNAKISVLKAGGEEALPYLTYEFDKVFVEAIEWSGGQGGDDAMETVSFAFGKVDILYQSQADEGTASGTYAASYDATTGTTS